MVAPILPMRSKTGRQRRSRRAVIENKAMADTPFLLVRKFLYLVFAKFYQRKLLRPHLVYEKHIWHIIASHLGVPIKRARYIYRQGSLDNARFWLDNKWMSYASPASIAKAVDEIKIENEEYIHLALSYSRPILIVSMHMGSYYLGFLKLASVVGDRREISVIKFNSATAQEAKIHALFEQRYGQLKPLRIGENPAHAAFAALRKGGVLALLTDMEVSVSGRSEVLFMGQSCYLQNGPAKLALATGAVIVPIVNCVDEGGHALLKIEKPFLARKEDCEELASSVQRITSAIASVLEKWIRTAPTQVHYWSEICRILQNTSSTPMTK